LVILCSEFGQSLLRLAGGLGTVTSELSLLHDADGNGVAHVTDSETAKRSEVRVGFQTHGFGRGQGDHSGITGLHGRRQRGGDLTSTGIELGQNCVELTGNVSSVAVQNRRVARLDLLVLQDDNLGEETTHGFGGRLLRVGGDVATVDLLDGQTLDVEANVVTRPSFGELLVVHLDTLALGIEVNWSKSDVHARLQNTSFNAADRDSSDTLDLVHILEGQTECLVGGTLRGLDRVEHLEKSLATVVFSTLFVPGHVFRLLDEIVTFQTGDRDKLGLLVHVLLLQPLLDVSADLVKAGFVVPAAVHLVQADDELLHTKSIGKSHVFLGGTLGTPTSLELTLLHSNHENGNISLRRSGNHVLDEVTVTRSVDDGEVELLGLEFPKRNVNGDTALALGLEFIQNPGILERSLAKLGSLLLELVNDTLVNASTLVDQVTSRGGLSGIYVADNDKVHVLFLFSHAAKMSV